jgi:hypothetical protein
VLENFQKVNIFLLSNFNNLSSFENDASAKMFASKVDNSSEIDFYRHEAKMRQSLSDLVDPIVE